MVKVCWVKKWTFRLVKNDPFCLYVFGDNNVQKGRGGQAIIRDLPNTIGIPTKKYPNFEDSSYYSDQDYSDNCQRIQKSITLIKAELEKGFYRWLVLPEDGFGTGLAKLPKKAPKTFNYLVGAVRDLVKEIEPGKIKSLDQLKGYQALQLKVKVKKEDKKT